MSSLRYEFRAPPPSGARIAGGGTLAVTSSATSGGSRPVVPSNGGARVVVRFSSDAEIYVDIGSAPDPTSTSALLVEADAPLERLCDSGDLISAILASDITAPGATVVVAAKADITLLTAASATGLAVAVVAGTYNWYAYGTWNSATAQLQWSPDGGTTWINVDGASLTANGGWSDIPLAAGHARVSFTGSPTSITSKLGGV